MLLSISTPEPVATPRQRYTPVSILGTFKLIPPSFSARVSPEETSIIENFEKYTSSVVRDHLNSTVLPSKVHSPVGMFKSISEGID